MIITSDRIVTAQAKHLAFGPRWQVVQSMAFGKNEGFVPVLEKIDKACLDNDLTALEINVEVLNEQLDRTRR